MLALTKKIWCDHAAVLGNEINASSTTAGQLPVRLPNGMLLFEPGDVLTTVPIQVCAECIAVRVGGCQGTF